MTPATSQARRLLLRVPDRWQQWQFEWALDFLTQLERGIWDIYEDEHIANTFLDAYDDERHVQLELPLNEPPGFADDEIPF